MKENYNEKKMEDFSFVRYEKFYFIKKIIELLIKTI